MKILLGDFNAKVGRENIFKTTIGNESLHEISNDSGVRVVKFATSAEGNTHNQIDHVLIDGRRHPSILDDRSFRGADCDTDQCLVVAK
jgi:hypothetical protein